MASRVIDATVTECVLSARAPVDRDTLEDLAACTDLPACLGAVPLLPEGAYGADALRPLAGTAPVLEPLTWAAHAAVAGMQRPPGCLVDPVGVPLGATYPEPAPPSGWVRECVAWIPAGTVDPDLLDAAVRLLPAAARLRLRDPHGALTPASIDTILHRDDAHRFTLALEDARGLAVATALRALSDDAGPQVRSALLGLGPRTGLPATELLLPDHAHALRGPAERAALIAGVPIPPQHPHWGARRHEVAEPERIDSVDPEAVPRWNAATIPALLEQHLRTFGFPAEPDQVARLAAALAARLRPGDTLDGPTLYAFLATHIDLTEATSGDGDGAS